MSDFKEIEVNGCKILRVNLAGIGNGPREDYLPILLKIKEWISSKPQNSVLTLTIVTNYKLTDTAIADIKDLLKHDQPFVKKAAVIGVDRLARIALNTFNKVLRRNMMLFETEPEAIAWLTKSK